MPTGFRTLDELKAKIAEQEGVGDQTAEQLMGSFRMLEFGVNDCNPIEDEEDWKLLFHHPDLRRVMQATVRKIIDSDRYRMRKAAKTSNDFLTMAASSLRIDEVNPLGI